MKTRLTTLAASLLLLNSAATFAVAAASPYNPRKEGWKAGTY